MKADYDTKLEIFIPEEYVARLLDELSMVNVGRIGNYDHCASVTRIQGYWRPLAGAHPFEGEIGKLSQESEAKVEVNCSKEYVAAALEVIRRVHPYDEPLVNIIPLVNPLYR
jgi:hypothetical protein